jgi:microcystin-dependent protein
MADPTTYAPTYSYSDFQSNSPTTPLPAPRVDIDFANIATSNASIVAAIKDIRRNDGALRSNIVTFDSLALGLQLTFDPTNGQLVAAAVATTQANAGLTAADRTATANSASAAQTSANAAAASASGINLTLYLPKAGNLAGLGSLQTSRDNLGLGTVATFNVGGSANNIVQLDTGAKLPAYDGSQLTNIDVLPVGTMIWSTGANALPGTIKANGALLSRTSFARLWAFAAASGNIVPEANWFVDLYGAYSTGDLSTTFRIPEMRGEFIRNFDDGRGLDASRPLGQRQLDTLKDHTHSYFGNQGTGAVSAAGGPSSYAAPAVALTTGSPSTGAATETRPRNIPLLACIKY